MRALLVAACLAVLSGCLAPPEDPPVATVPPPPPPPPPPPLDPPPPPVPTVCGRTSVLDTGRHGGFPGSGVGQDGGIGQLWLVRIDRGTANLADSIQRLIQRTTAALRDARLAPRGIAVVSLYDGALVWSTTNASRDPLITVAPALNARAALDNPAPAGCATFQLFDLGRQLSGIGAPANPFAIRPGALLVGIVDHGARPAPLVSCGDPAAALAADIACWASFGSVVLQRAEFRFGFFATPETGTTAQMKTGCLAVPGLPVTTIDSLEASDFTFFDPLAQQMEQRQPGLATRFDLCRAFGSDAPVQLATFANAWAQLLAAQP
ncbi:MAG: hypothetical protein ACJ79H_05310 [Myxococcales bacterium]